MIEAWIEEVINMPEQWLNIAAGKALRILKQRDVKGVDEALVGFDLSIRLLDQVFEEYIRQKDTLSEAGKEKFTLAVELAKVSIPMHHPIYRRFIKKAAFIDPRLEQNENAAQ